MAKLSTPSHDCSIRYVNEYGVPTGQHCPFAAYKRHGGKWLCRTHLRRAKALAAKAAEEGATK